jgi:hypothetical protein
VPKAVGPLIQLAPASFISAVPRSPDAVTSIALQAHRPSDDRQLRAGLSEPWAPPVGRARAGGPVGSRHRQQLNGEFIAALLRDFRQGGPKAIERVRRTQPAAYLKILALLMPRERKVEHRNLVASLTDEELEAAIEAIQKMLATQAENAKVIEGTTAPIALPVPTEPEQPGRKRSNRLLDHVDTAIGPNARGKRKPQ